MMSAALERLDELLTDRALVGLEADEAYELETLLREHPHVNASSYDHAAAATALASMRLEPMPSHLLARIEADAIALLAHRPASNAPRDRAKLARTAPMEDAPARPVAPSSGAPPPPAVPFPLGPNVPPLRPVPYVGALAPQAPSSPPVGQPAPRVHVYDARVVPGAAAPATNVVPLRAGAGPGSGSSLVLLVSGWVAAAAILVFAIGAYLSKKPDSIANVPPAPSTAPSPPPVLASAAPKGSEDRAEGRAKLLAMAGTVRTEWTATKDPAASGAKGDVVWNAAEQKGYMRFSGLAKNDPRGAQYQLWIFDKTRDDKYPVDGGVFDVDQDSGDVIVPITARLPVAQASLFAVTVEKPGGVVVSKRERIVVTAKPVG